MDLSTAMDIVYPMKFVDTSKKQDVKQKYFCTHWDNGQACYYSQMHRCKEQSYGCEFNQM